MPPNFLRVKDIDLAAGIAASRSFSHAPGHLSMGFC
jgi:hypothetical protein